MSYDIYLFEPRDGESVEDAYELAVEGKGGEGPGEWRQSISDNGELKISRFLFSYFLTSWFDLLFSTTKQEKGKRKKPAENN